MNAGVAQVKNERLQELRLESDERHPLPPYGDTEWNCHLIQPHSEGLQKGCRATYAITNMFLKNEMCHHQAEHEMLGS